MRWLIPLTLVTGALLVAPAGASGAVTWTTFGDTPTEDVGSVNFTVTRANVPVGEPTRTISYTIAAGTATAGSDYGTPTELPFAGDNATDGMLTFGPNDSTRQISVPITDDTLVEDGHEHLTMYISGIPAGQEYTSRQGFISIKDNEGPITNFSHNSMFMSGIRPIPPAVDFTEGGFFEIDVQRSNVVALGGTSDCSSPASLGYLVQPGSARASDFGAATDTDGGTPGTVNFPAGACDANVVGPSKQRITIQLTDDAFKEDRETFAVMLRNPGPPHSDATNGYALDGNTIQIITISDNDPAGSPEPPETTPPGGGGGGTPLTPVTPLTPTTPSTPAPAAPKKKKKCKKKGAAAAKKCKKK